ncbi:MAG: ribokinase RbsK [Phormidesmis priestleyi Ana]|uniref:Ribokinase n=1 Tax=Phormidesmis priestleyi Ana TaxID=1666911 RepID=A0A0P7ZUB3_9CYAN|nr:MAG: ribokinase RbsK [Phormidesmis priestleyi Ana]
MAEVLVLGSVNMDLVAEVDRLPRPGETLTGRGFATVPGGKGANQAVAAARLGMRTAMVGRVGKDGFGRILSDRLHAENVDTSALVASRKQPSGTALITLSPTDNQIIVVSGANAELGEADLDRLTPFFKKARVLLLQFEVPLPTVEKAAALAYLAGLTVIVDPAPAPKFGEPLSTDFCEYISVLTPNQTEAEQLTGIEILDVTGAIAAAEMLRGQGIEVVIITMGALGSVCTSANGSFAIPAFPVPVIDTIGAGDAFNGGLAAALCRADPALRLNDHNLLRPALDYASAVAALAVTRSGAQSAMPTAAEVEDFLKAR